MNSRRLSGWGPQCPEQLHLRMICLLQFQLSVLIFIGDSAIRLRSRCQAGKRLGEKERYRWAMP
jgi:hypothetical protein